MELERETTVAHIILTALQGRSVLILGLGGDSNEGGIVYGLAFCATALFLLARNLPRILAGL